MRLAKYCVASLLSLVVLTVLFGVLAEGGRAAPPKLKILVATGFDVHKWKETTALTRSVLEESGRFDVKVCEDLGIFESSTLKNYDAIVLNYGFWRAPELSPAARAGLLAYVKSGKGLVPLHFSCSSFQEWDEYRELIGRIWTKGVGGHGPRGKFKVEIVDKEHPVTRGLADFEADDELYAKLTGDAKIHVLATADSAWSKKVEPIVFVKKYGEGRVVHNLLGHDLRSRKIEAYQTLLKRCVEWAASGKIAAE